MSLNVSREQGIEDREIDPTTRIVVTGLGAVTPLGLDVKETWGRLVAGESGIVEHHFEDYPQINVSVAGLVPDRFQSEQALAGMMAVKDIRHSTHRSAHFSLAATHEALKQAGLLMPSGVKNKQWTVNPEIIDPNEIATVIGTGIGGADILGKVGLELEERTVSNTKLIFHALPERVATVPSMAYKLRGPSYTLAAACATSNVAITNGIMGIMCGDATIAVVGGSEACAVPIGTTLFDRINTLDKESDPSKTPRPLDQTAGGFVMGEGAGILVLERLDFARARGATILAEVVGYGNTSDADHPTVPNGEGAERAMGIALKRAKAKGADEGELYINMHATGTHVGDPVEMRAIHNVFDGQQESVWISGTKGATGHDLGAAGGIEAVIGIMALTTDIIPPTLRLENPIPETEGWNVVRKEAVARKISRVLSNGFGFGGENSSLIFAKY